MTKYINLFMGVAAAAAIALPEIALATPTTTTTYTINTRIDGRAPVTRFGPPRTHDAGLANNSGLSIQEDPTDNAANAFSATSRVPAGGGGASLHTAVALGNVSGALNEADAFAKAIVGDSLTFSNATSISQIFHLHKKIDLRSISDGAFTPAMRPGSSETFNITSEIFGDGISGDIKRTEQFFSNIDGHSTTGSSELPSVVDFDMDFTIGETREFNITISVFDQILLLNDQGYPFDRNDLFMQFLSGGTLTDVMTGQAACGVTATSASGFNYLQGIDIAACQVGGGGDGGNGGSGAGGVPEPASWAMMLCGFGLVGGAMRSFRRKAVVTLN